MDLGSPRLFSHPPSTAIAAYDLQAVIEDINDHHYDDAADKLYGLLQLDSYTDEAKLKLWQARLTLLMFTQLERARHEAVALNNHLFLLENDAPAASVYPLPRNNPMIPTSLLSLLLRLKSKPSVTVINEIYKLVYQTRLKSTKGGDTRQQLMVASYEVLAALVASHQWLVVLNMASSTQSQAQAHNHDDYRDYASNLSLVVMIVSALVGKEISPAQFDQLQLSTKQSWKYAVNNLGDYTGTFADIAAVVSSATTLAPVLERLLAIWTLTTSLQCSVDDLDHLAATEHASDVDGLVTTVNAHWPRNLAHYYGH